MSSKPIRTGKNQVYWLYPHNKSSWCHAYIALTYKHKMHLHMMNGASNHYLVFKFSNIRDNRFLGYYKVQDFLHNDTNPTK